MCHNIPEEEEVNTEVHERETSLMSGSSLEENSHDFTTKNLDVSKRIVDTLGKKKVLRMMLNLERFLRRRVLPP